MIKRVVLFSSMAVALACGEGVAKAKAQPFTWVEARDMIQPPITGPTPPPLHPEDYEPYRRPGGATITGVMRVVLADGTQVPCRYGLASDEAVLMPATPYTIWALERWTALADHRYYKPYERGMYYPGDDDPSIPMPSYLLHHREHVIQLSECEDGRFTFYNVPNGSYMVFGRAGLDYLKGYSEPGRESAVTTPEGSVEVLGPSHSGLQTIEGQQWTIVSVGAMKVTQPRVYEVKSDHLKPAATWYYSTH